MSKIYITPPVPFRIKVNLTKNKKFVIKGRPLEKAKRFTLNFQKGQLPDASNIAFHFDVRYDCRVIVMNYRNTGQWGQEIRPSTFPFSEKEQFTLEIYLDSEMYTVDVNGTEVGQFQHQRPIQLVDAFTIEGDVFLSEVKVM